MGRRGESADVGKPVRREELDATEAEPLRFGDKPSSARGAGLRRVKDEQEAAGDAAAEFDGTAGERD